MAPVDCAMQFSGVHFVAVTHTRLEPLAIVKGPAMLIRDKGDVNPGAWDGLVTVGADLLTGYQCYDSCPEPPTRNASDGLPRRERGAEWCYFRATGARGHVQRSNEGVQHSQLLC